MTGIWRWITGIFIFVKIFTEGTNVHMFVRVNQPATLYSNARSCQNGEWTKTSPTDATIAICQNHICAIEEGFQKRFKFEDTSNNLVLTSAKYSDSGEYKCTCSGTKSSVLLDVIVPVNVTVPESGNITLPCYAANAKDVTWYHENKKILQSKTGESPWIAKEFENRLSLKKSCYEDDDFSLTIFNVHKTDAGLYRCFANDEAAKGYPHAYMVHVTENHTSSGGKQTDLWYVVAIIEAVIIAVLGLIIVFPYVKRCVTNRNIKTPSTSAASETEEHNENEPFENDRMLENVNLSHLITQPVQESESKSKSSSTQPF